MSTSLGADTAACACSANTVSAPNTMATVVPFRQASRRISGVLTANSCILPLVHGCIALTEDVPAEAAAMTCANIGNGIRWACTKGGVSVGDTVVVIGPGGQGLAAILAAREAGAAQIVAIGLTQDNHRFEVARHFGATHLINLQVEDPVQTVRESYRWRVCPMW